MEDPQPYAWRLPLNVPIACLAADEQEIEPTWPRWAAGHCADVVFTPTRTVILGEEVTPIEP